MTDEYDEDLQALVTDAYLSAENERVKLLYLRVCSETGETPRAQVTLSVDGEERKATAEGGGPVDASFKAIESILQTGTDLLLYSVNNITSGTDSQGEVTYATLGQAGMFKREPRSMSFRNSRDGPR